MRSKGFTLIELLAVIVILAIIALIAVPIVLNIVNDSKKEANQRSIEMYAKAIESSIARVQLDRTEGIVGSFDTTELENKLKVEYEGNVVCDIIEICEDGNIYLSECKVNDEPVEYRYSSDGKIHLSKENITAITASIDVEGNVDIGSKFKIKVSDEIGELTFFVLSNDGEYVNLIAEQNIDINGRYTKELQENDDWYKSSSNSNDSTFGPQTAYTYLNEATKKWINVPIIESFNYEDKGHILNPNIGYQSLITKLDKKTGKYITTITSLTGKTTTYENMRARLPYYDEISNNTDCGNFTSTNAEGSCPLWMVNYLYSNNVSDIYYNQSNGKESATEENKGYWMLSSSSIVNNYARYVDFSGSMNTTIETDSDNIGVRPVIKVLKSDLLLAMK